MSVPSFPPSHHNVNLDALCISNSLSNSFEFVQHSYHDLSPTAIVPQSETTPVALAQSGLMVSLELRVGVLESDCRKLNPYSTSPCNNLDFAPGDPSQSLPVFKGGQTSSNMYSARERGRERGDPSNQSWVLVFDHVAYR